MLLFLLFFNFFNVFFSKQTKNYFFSYNNTTNAPTGTELNPFQFLNSTKEMIMNEENISINLILMSDNEIFLKNQSEIFFYDSYEIR